MTRTIMLHDEGIKDIINEVTKLATRYRKQIKKDPSKATLQVIFKRGPITMANGEWSKLPYNKLTLDPNKVESYFKRSNLNWGILGYGSTKGGLKELMKFAKTKLNPKQLLGEKQDLKMKINKTGLFKKGEEVIGRIIITVPDKALGGTDIRSTVLEKQGYLGINSWQKEALALLGDDELDSRLKAFLKGEVKLSDIVEKHEDKAEENDSQEDKADKEDLMEALQALGYKKTRINNIIGKVDMSKTTSEAVKHALNILSGK